MISLIVAIASNGVIGKDNRLPWRLPGDLAYFKRITMGHTIVMGRKTYESIGKPLPGRQNVIVTRNRHFKSEGCIVINSLEEALKLAENDEVFIIGGAEIYSQAISIVERLYITHVNKEFEGDTYFPQIDSGKWKIISREEGETNEKNPYEYSFLIYERI